MNPTRKTAFWIWSAVFTLGFITACAFLAFNLNPGEPEIVLPAMIVMFAGFVLFYLSPLYVRLTGKSFWSRLALVLILVLPTAFLGAWLAFARGSAFASFVWFAPFMGLGVGVNMRAALG